MRKIAYAGWLTNNGNLFLHSSEAGKSKINKPTDSWSGEAASWFIDGAFSLRPQMEEGVRELSPASSIKALIPCMWAPPS